MILAVDHSTVATGFAFGGEADASPRGGTWKLPGADELVFSRTCGELLESVRGTARNVGATKLIIEQPMYVIDRGHSAKAAAALSQLVGVLRAAGDRAGCAVVLAPVYDVRKYFIGNGRMKRDEAKRAVKDRCRILGWDYQDDNHADAIACWAWAMAKFYPKWRPGVGTEIFSQKLA